MGSTFLIYPFTSLFQPLASCPGPWEAQAMHGICGLPCLWLWEESAGECSPLSFFPADCDEVAAFLPKSHNSCQAALSSSVPLPSSHTCFPHLLCPGGEGLPLAAMLVVSPSPPVSFNPAHPFVNSPSPALLPPPHQSKPVCFLLGPQAATLSGLWVQRDCRRGDRGREVKRRASANGHNLK